MLVNDVFHYPNLGELVNVKCGSDGCDTSGPENHECFPIPIPSNDEVFRDRDCLMLVRSQEFMQDTCKLGMNAHIHFSF